MDTALTMGDCCFDLLGLFLLLSRWPWGKAQLFSSFLANANLLADGAGYRMYELRSPASESPQVILFATRGDCSCGPYDGQCAWLGRICARLFFCGNVWNVGNTFRAPWSSSTWVATLIQTNAHHSPECKKRTLAKTRRNELHPGFGSYFDYTSCRRGER
eukprot:GHVT01056720.1.p1 GENE.GHVT01056720.1~~GHVT01056720.1.p1  ORF type:complete len:160 (-),score=10.59 GHVT01056720.1:64-543(-)